MKTKKTGWPGLSGLAIAHRRSSVDHDTGAAWPPEKEEYYLLHVGELVNIEV